MGASLDWFSCGNCSVHITYMLSLGKLIGSLRIIQEKILFNDLRCILLEIVGRHKSAFQIIHVSSKTMQALPLWLHPLHYLTKGKDNHLGRNECWFFRSCCPVQKLQLRGKKKYCLNLLIKIYLCTHIVGPKNPLEGCGKLISSIPKGLSA